MIRREWRRRELHPPLRSIKVVLTIDFARSTEAPGSERGRNRETPTLDVHRNRHTRPSLASAMHTTLALARSQNQPHRALDRPGTCARRSDDTNGASLGASRFG